MKKFLFVMLVTFGVVLTSCIKNEEPEGLKVVRFAKAELLKAEAQYKLAEIALINVDVKMKEALVANQLIDNQILETLLQKRLIEVEMKALELALAEAKNEADIKAIEAEMLKHELAIITAQFELDKKIAQIEMDMMELEIEIKKAEASYQASLRILAYEAQYLSEDEQDIVNDLKMQLIQLRVSIGRSYDRITALEREIYDMTKNLTVGDDLTVDAYLAVLELQKESIESMIEFNEKYINDYFDKLIEKATTEELIDQYTDTRDQIKAQEVILEGLKKEKAALEVNTEADWKNFYEEHAKLVDLIAERDAFIDEMETPDMEGDVSIKMVANPQIQSLFLYLMSGQLTDLLDEINAELGHMGEPPLTMEELLEKIGFTVPSIDPATGYPKFADNLTGFELISYNAASEMLSDLAEDFTSYNTQNPEWLAWLELTNLIDTEALDAQYKEYKKVAEDFVKARNAWLEASGSKAYAVGFENDMQAKTVPVYTAYKKAFDELIAKVDYTKLTGAINTAIADTTTATAGTKVTPTKVKKAEADIAEAEKGLVTLLKTFNDKWAFVTAADEVAGDPVDTKARIDNSLTNLWDITNPDNFISSANAIKLRIDEIEKEAEARLGVDADDVNGVGTDFGAYITAYQNNLTALLELAKLKDELAAAEKKIADARAALTKALEPIEAIWTPFMATFNAYVDARSKLDGSITPADAKGWADLTFEGYTDSKTKLWVNGYMDAYATYNTNIASVLNSISATLENMAATEASIQGKWHLLSLAMYGLDFALTDFANDTHYKNSIKFGWLPWGDVDNVGEVGDDLTFEFYSNDLAGFINSNFEQPIGKFTLPTGIVMATGLPADFTNSAWYNILQIDFWRTVVAEFPAFFEAAETMVANFNEAKATIDAALEEVEADYAELEEALAAKQKAVADQLELLRELREAMEPAEAEDTKLNIKIRTVERYISELEGYLTTLEDLLTSKWDSELDIDFDDLDFEDFDSEVIQEGLILIIKMEKNEALADILELKSDLAQIDKEIAALKAGEFDEQRAIEDKQKELDLAKEILEKKLAAFDELTKKLEAALAAFTKE